MHAYYKTYFYWVKYIKITFWVWFIAKVKNFSATSFCSWIRYMLSYIQILITSYTLLIFSTLSMRVLWSSLNFSNNTISRLYQLIIWYIFWLLSFLIVQLLLLSLPLLLMLKYLSLLTYILPIQKLVIPSLLLIRLLLLYYYYYYYYNQIYINYSPFKK